MLNGILLIDKEEGITSYDVIRKIKHILWEQGRLKTEKIGHAGTLDPFASGLMILLFGKATKRFDEFLKYRKTYIATGKFGASTDTQDLTGEIIEKYEDIDKKPLKINELEELIQNNFTGDINQMPPKYSAKKIAGRNAYDLARAGEEFELKLAKVNVSKYEIINYKWPEVEFEINCSSGTYIRTLIHDLGQISKKYAYCNKLRRTAIGPFSVNEALKSSDITEKFELQIAE